MTADLEFMAQLSAQIGGLSGQLSRRESLLQEMDAAVTAPETPAISFTGSQAPYAPPAWGPSVGYTWFVQLLTVGPLGAGDTLAVYRGRTPQENMPQKLKNQFLGSVNAWQAWAPGRTGLKLAGGWGGLVFDPGSGTLTSGTRYYVNVDVIQVADAFLGRFLL